MARVSTENNAVNDEEFIRICADGDTAKVEEAISNGANIDARNKYGRTALMFAAGNGHIGIVELLLKHGADVNAKGNDGWTALMSAVSKRYTEITKLLYSYGAK